MILLLFVVGAVLTSLLLSANHKLSAGQARIAELERQVVALGGTLGKPGATGPAGPVGTPGVPGPAGRSTPIVSGRSPSSGATVPAQGPRPTTTTTTRPPSSTTTTTTAPCTVAVLGRCIP
jgi:hypothetical protein